ncbi:NAD(P)H-dependent oxidoreductase [Streptomyces sp. GbtcB7]|uniref:NAD(P)H-dependent oxidoreductase n=1 Tax=Streptomyces sp. GbtcB7 TaxID=2824752 RepID=UPI001C2F9270|nr:NAD(P)H-dependent oxidoreductase [Streptomyces sp. GbtcB7]
MATLLHIDSSVFPGEASSSRSVADAFRRGPGRSSTRRAPGTVIYRDLAAAPVPHITADAWSAGYAAPCEHTPEQSAAFAARVKLIEELERADAVKDTLGLGLDFIVPELAMAPRRPAMSELVPLYEASRKRAFEDTTAKARQLAEHLAA